MLTVSNYRCSINTSVFWCRIETLDAFVATFLEPQQAKHERNLETFLIQFGETFDCTRPAAKWFFDPCTVANRLITARSPARFRSGTTLFMV
jgi:hypothetical protein